MTAFLVQNKRTFNRVLSALVAKELTNSKIQMSIVNGTKTVVNMEVKLISSP